MLNFIYGSSKRIFLNTAIGCNAKCSYCYLPKLGVRGSETRTTADKVLDVLQNVEYLQKGREGSVISLGCYSECLDTANISETYKLLAGLFPLENKIQLATKQKISTVMAQHIVCNRVYREQVTVYISMPTISHIPHMEPGTASYKDRVSNIELCELYDIPKVLYIKPFITDVTINDLSKYIALVQKYRLPVVVGNYLSDGGEEIAADVGEGFLYDSGASDEKADFIFELRKYTDVFKHSTEAMLGY